MISACLGALPTCFSIVPSSFSTTSARWASFSICSAASTSFCLALTNSVSFSRSPALSATLPSPVSTSFSVGATSFVMPNSFRYSSAMSPSAVNDAVSRLRSRFGLPSLVPTAASRALTLSLIVTGPRCPTSLSIFAAASITFMPKFVPSRSQLRLSSSTEMFVPPGPAIFTAFPGCQLAVDLKLADARPHLILYAYSY